MWIHSLDGGHRPKAEALAATHEHVQVVVVVVVQAAAAAAEGGVLLCALSSSSSPPNVDGLRDERRKQRRGERRLAAQWRASQWRAVNVWARAVFGCARMDLRAQIERLVVVAALLKKLAKRHARAVAEAKADGGGGGRVGRGTAVAAVGRRRRRCRRRPLLSDHLSISAALHFDHLVSSHVGHVRVVDPTLGDALEGRVLGEQVANESRASHRDKVPPKLFGRDRSSVHFRHDV
jgi:hypothetical protein